MMPDRRGQHALVLAAGMGRRFGGGKLLADWRGRPLIQSSVAAALGAPVELVTVVLGCEAALVAEALAPLADDRLRYIENRDWAQGMASSLQAGIAALPSDAENVFVFLGDMPSVPHDVAGRLLDSLTPGTVAVEPRFCGTPGHPVLVTSALFPAMRQITGDRGIRSILPRSGVVVIEDLRADIVFDVDTADHLAQGPNIGPFGPFGRDRTAIR
jgi:molybdenum cofactor cytidylyltransferase